MGNIVLLDDLTINKIAAGEVIERPASVVKELVENSIDAGATSINVEIKNGGISFIRIIDNGKGIMADDMEIAFERHATSKIRNAADLAVVKSMGFRGEALASIAAISKVTMKSRTQDKFIGNCIIVEGGKVLGMEETACPQGTAITIENLFYNTPVRYKFLKKDFTESGYIEDCITRIALVNPHIAIKLVSGGKTVIQTSGNGKLRDVIYNIYGKEVAENIIKVKTTYEDVEIEGVIGKPVIARSNRSNQLFFVNDRYVKDKTLTAATEKAFKGMITIGKFGFLVLNIKMNPEQVDSNVHPAKLEVRFQDEGKIFKAVYHCIKDNLLDSNLVSQPIEKEIKNDPSIEEHRANEGELIKRRNTEKIEELYNSIKNKKLNYNEVKEVLEKQKEESYIEENIEKYENKPKSKVEELFSNIKPKEADESSNIIEELYQNKQTKEENQKIDSEKQSTETDENGMFETNKVPDLEEIESNINQIETNVIDMESNIKESELDIGDKEEKSKIVLENLINKLKENGIEVETMEKFKENNSKISDINEIEEIKNIQEKDEELNKKDKQEIIDELYEENRQEEKQKIIEKLEENNKTEKQEVSYEEFEKMYRTMFGYEKDNEEENSNIEVKNKTISIIDGEENNEIILEEREIDTTIRETNLFENENIDKISNYKYIGIAFSTYIIIEIENEMYILDQHAAHERIMYEKIKENYYNNEEKDTQIMLLPDIIDLTHKEKMIIQENIELFEKAGFMLEEFGESTIKLIGVPNICIDLDTKELFLETLDEINTVAKTAKQEIEEKFIATIACKAAVKANMSLDEEEVRSLINDLLKLENPFTCPHGRPTAIKMSKQEIEKKFSRR